MIYCYHSQVKEMNEMNEMTEAQTAMEKFNAMFDDMFDGASNIQGETKDEQKARQERIEAEKQATHQREIGYSQERIDTAEANTDAIDCVTRTDAWTTVEIDGETFTLDGDTLVSEGGKTYRTIRIKISQKLVDFINGKVPVLKNKFAQWLSESYRSDLDARVAYAQEIEDDPEGAPYTPVIGVHIEPSEDY